MEGFYPYKGISIVRLTKVDRIGYHHFTKGKTAPHFEISFKDEDSIRHAQVLPYTNNLKSKFIYVYYRLECSNIDIKHYPWGFYYNSDNKTQK